MMTNETMDFAFEVKEVDDDALGTFEGYASVFDEVDFVRDSVTKGAFKRTLRAHRRNKRMPALLWQHDVRDPIGVWEELKEDDHGLYGRGQLFVEDIPRAKAAHALLKGGGLSGLSIGFRTVKSMIDEKKKTRNLLDVDLHEISLVTFPALDSARVSSVKCDDIRTIRDFETFLRDEGGFSHAAAKQIATHGFKTFSDHRDDDGGADLMALAQSLKRGASIINP